MMRYTRCEQLNMHGRRLFRRGISALLAASLFFQGAIISNPMEVEAAGATSTKWSNMSEVVVNGVNLNMTKRLTAFGGGQYELEFTAEGTTTISYESESSRAAKEGFYIILKTGTYQIDLYGGKGGNGKAGGRVSECVGGTAGHVHAQYHFQAGQVLYYSIGGNGTNTSSAGTGGGANGGGNNSGTGNATGGGGGYSVVYLVNDFIVPGAQSLTREQADSIKSQTFDPSTFSDQYLMIAGGGGGGGALTFLSGSNANGGAGGTMDSATYGAASGMVPGTWYGGVSGNSSGNGNTGAGGGNISTTWEAERNGSESADRGGAGGAGFAGGGNGNSNTLNLLNIGGGGGGSSFVADANSGTGTAVKKVTETIVANDSMYGGSVTFTDISTRNEARDKGEFKAVISKYFTVGDVTVSSEAGVYAEANVDKQIDGAGATIVAVSGLALDNMKQTIKIKLSANYSNSFGGGNNVPIFERKTISRGGGTFDVCAVKMTLGDASNEQATVHFANTADDLLDKDLTDDPSDIVTDYANVPLKYSVKAQSFSNGSHEGKTVKDLYDYTIGDPAAPANAYTTNDYISALSYGAYINGTDANDPSNKLDPDTALDVNTYMVTLTVTPQDTATTGLAAVGSEVKTTTFSTLALITQNIPTNIVNPGTPGTSGESGGNVVVTKNLSYTDGKYTLAVNMNGNATGQVPYKSIFEDTELIEQVKYTYSETNGIEGNYTYEVPYDGYYFIQAWGGDGGKGGDATSWSLSGNRTNFGGVGGYGAYLEGFVYLTAGTMISGTCGKKGLSVTETISNGDAQPGGGGLATTVIVTAPGQNESKTVLIAAGGGGGGGASSHFMGTAKNGLGRTETNEKLDNSEWCGGRAINGAWYTNEFDSNESSDATIITLIRQKNIISDTTGQNANGGDGEPGGEETGSNKNALSGNAGISYVNTGVINLINTEFDMSADAMDKMKLQSFTDAKTFAFDTSDKRVTNSTIHEGAVQITCVQIKPEVQYVEDTEGVGNMVKQLSHLISTATLSLDFSKYFDVDNSDGDAQNLVVSGTYKTAADAEATAFEPNDLSQNGKTVAVSTENAKTYTAYETDKISDGADARTQIRVQAEYTVYFTFEAESEFLGGNDVPVLEIAAEGAEYCNMTVMMSDTETEIPILIDPATDYANVPLKDGILDLIGLEAINTEQHVISGETIDTPLYQEQNMLPADWKADYIEYVAASISPALEPNPTQTIQYTVTAGVKPKVENPQAVACDPVSGQYKNVVNTVYVDRSVTVVANGATASGFPSQVAEGESINGYVTANEGHTLPASITVSGASDYTYDNTTGSVHIPADKITGNVTIQVNADTVQCNIQFIIVATDGTQTVYLEKTVNYGADIGAEIKAANDYVAGQDVYVPGHTFGWLDMPELDAEGHYYLKTGGLKVYGGYVPNLHRVTVNYVYEDGTEAAETKIIQNYFDETYTVESLALTGYTPYIAREDDGEYTSTGVLAEIVSGTMPDADVEVTVVYVPNKYNVTVKYVYEDGSAAAESNSFQATYGVAYSVESPTIQYYVADSNKVDVEIDKTNPQDVEITVTYYPQKFTLSINYVYEENGREAATSYTEEVPHSSAYSVNSPEIAYYLPDLSAVTGIMPKENVTITVTYKAIPAGLTVRFFYEGGTPLLDSDGKPLEYHVEGKQGEKIELPSSKYPEMVFPELMGYSRSENSAVKPAGQKSKVVDIIYEPNSYTLTINYVDVNGNPMKNGNENLPSHSEVVVFNESYSVQTPVITGYTPNVGTVSGIMDAEGKEISVTYTANLHKVTLYYYIYGENLPKHSKEWIDIPYGSSNITFDIPEQLVIGDLIYEGYEPRKSEESLEVWTQETVGFMPDEDLEYHVYYYPKRYTVNIIGVDPFGDPLMADEHTYLIADSVTVKHGITQTIKLPTLSGYVAKDADGNTITTITDTWTSAADYEVVYTQDDVIYYVTVDWGNLVYDYSQRSNWDGGTHRYDIPPATDGSNYVKVTNHKYSTQSIFADVFFVPLADYPTMTGHFSINSKTGETVAAVKDDILTKGATKTYWLWLKGSMTTQQQNVASQVVGNCTVTINATKQGG